MVPLLTFSKNGPGKGLRPEAPLLAAELGLAKTMVTLVITLVVLAIVAEGGILLYGLQQMKVGDPQVQGDTLVIPLVVPNMGFVDLGGTITVSVLDKAGAVLETTTTSFNVPAGKTETVHLTSKMPRSEAASKVRVEATVSLAGMVSIPLPATEAGIPRT